MWFNDWQQSLFYIIYRSLAFKCDEGEGGEEEKGEGGEEEEEGVGEEEERVGEE